VSATKVFGAAIALGVIGRWANNKKALPSMAGILQVTGALFLVSFMDRGKTEPVAKGLAWLFMAAILLSDSSPLTGLVKAEQANGRIPTAAPGNGGGSFPGAAGATTPPPANTQRRSGP
jgi:hypothetical protein